jgi:hypothetical protein
MNADEKTRLLYAYFDDRLAIAACAVDPASPAGLAIAEMRDTLPDVMSLLAKSITIVEAVADRVAVLEEHRETPRWLDEAFNSGDGTYRP